MKRVITLSLVVAVMIIAAGPLVCSLGAPWHAHAAASLPEVTGPIPVSADSYPFGAAIRSNAPQDLSRSGYVEEEYFVSCLANVYDLDPQGNTVIRTPGAPYTTRILVRRPATPEGFSGTVVVELLNPTALHDLAPQWGFCGDYFMEEKDIWVGITAKPVAAQALRTYDPKRYTSLSWANPFPPEKTCEPVSLFGDSTRATENGLVWDIASQVGALAKSASPHNPLKAFPVKRAYLTGYSQTGGYVATYINFIRPLASATLPDGKPVYDGYLIGDGDGLLPGLNQCSNPPKPGDPLFVIQPRPEPVVSIVSQSLLAVNNAARRSDSDSPGDRYRRYEIPGAAHVNERGVLSGVSLEDHARTGAPPPVLTCRETDTYGLTDFPLEYFMDAAFMNLDAWVRSGTLPPKISLIRAKATSGSFIATVEFDQYGNALGGLRSPYLDVPVATYHANSTASDLTSGMVCFLQGYKVPFGKDVLATLYPTHEAYVKKVAEKVEELVKERLLTRTDGEKIKKEAARAAVP